MHEISEVFFMFVTHILTRLRLAELKKCEFFMAESICSHFPSVVNLCLLNSPAQPDSASELRE